MRATPFSTCASDKDEIPPPDLRENFADHEAFDVYVRPTQTRDQGVGAGAAA